jgi:hypothetical protein
MNVCIAYYVVALVISLAAFGMSDYGHAGVSLAAFVGAFFRGELIRPKVVGRDRFPAATAPEPRGVARAPRVFR